MTPSVGETFPLILQEESVLSSKRVLLNKQTVLPAGTLLRCCFQMPEKNSADLKRKQKKNSIENTFSRKPIKVTSKNEDFDPYREAVKDRAFKTIWKQPDLFRGYFYKVDASRYYLVYQLPGAETPAFAQFFFPEGLFLCAAEGQIEVLSVQVGSRAEAAGFSAGDRVHSLEDIELNGDLKLFLSHYHRILKKNKLSGKGLNFQVSPLDGTEVVTREIKLPLSISSDPFGPIGE